MLQIPRVLRVLLAVVIGGVAALSLTTPAEAAPALSVSRTSVISGETVRFAGKVGNAPRRQVVLQRKAGNRWQRVATTTTRARGAFSFSVRLTGAAGSSKTYRAQAGTATTAQRTVRFVAQTAELTAPDVATVGEEFSVTATFRPARKGRTTILERRTGDTWAEVARGKQDRRGRTVFSPSLTPAGDTDLRAVTAAAGGAPARTTAAKTVAVLPPVLVRASESAAGVGGDGASYFPSISSDGRYIAFHSGATNLVPGDTNGAVDVFVRDRLTGSIERISVTDAGQEAPLGGEQPSISGNGRYVAFASSSQLTADPNSSIQNIFVRDREAGTTVKVSVPKAGDLIAGNSSYHPSISADGQSVAFASLANNLVPGDSNGFADVFLRDLAAGTTVRVSTDNDGGQANGASAWPEISGDGQFVTYDSTASNLVADDTNVARDVFWWPRSSGSTLRVSQTEAGVQADDISYLPSISADGRYVAFTTRASNLTGTDDNGSTDVLRWDSQSLDLVEVSVSDTEGPAQFDAGSASISADGTQVVFSAYDALAAGDTNNAYDLHVRDLALGTTRRVTDTSTGGPSNGASEVGVLSADGTTVAFSSLATNLVPGADTNATLDVFARDLTR